MSDNELVDNAKKENSKFVENKKNQLTPELKIIFNKDYDRHNRVKEPQFSTWFSVDKVAPALLWLLGKDQYSPTADSLAEYMTYNGYQIKGRTIKDWKMKYDTPELLWSKMTALAVQLTVQAYNSTRGHYRTAPREYAKRKRSAVPAKKVEIIDDNDVEQFKEGLTTEW